MKGITKEWALTFAFSGLILLALGFGLTWVNIERTDMAYTLRRLQTDIDSQTALISKLEVERDSLTSPDRLRELAGQYGLTQARPGQVRRLAASGEELPSPLLAGAPAPDKPQKSVSPASAAKHKVGAKNKQLAKNSGRKKGRGKDAPAQPGIGNSVTIGAAKP